MRCTLLHILGEPLEGYFSVTSFLNPHPLHPRGLERSAGPQWFSEAVAASNDELHLARATFQQSPLSENFCLGQMHLWSPARILHEMGRPGLSKAASFVFGWCRKA